jgi:hypothetical protein
MPGGPDGTPPEAGVTAASRKAALGVLCDARRTKEIAREGVLALLRFRETDKRPERLSEMNSGRQSGVIAPRIAEGFMRRLQVSRISYDRYCLVTISSQQ